MADAPEIEKLKSRIAELEQKLAEEREEFHWDLKAAKESAEKSVKKLEEELAQARKGAPAPAVETADARRMREQLDMVTQRALLAEKKVAELQGELNRRPSLNQPPPLKTDNLLLQRAQSAEEERDRLLRELRAAQRSLEEKDTLLNRHKAAADEARAAKADLEAARRALAERDKELQKAREAQPQAAQREQELARAREESTRLQAELARAQKELEQVRRDSAGLTDARAERETLQAEIQKLKDEIARTRMASGQMLEQRERETERLRADLKSAAERQGQDAAAATEARRERDRLRQELAESRVQIDELVRQLHRLREGAATQVQRPPARDDFEEKTQPFQPPVWVPSENTQRIQMPRGLSEKTPTEPAAPQPQAPLSSEPAAQPAAPAVSSPAPAAGAPALALSPDDALSAAPVGEGVLELEELAPEDLIPEEPPAAAAAPLEPQPLGSPQATPEQDPFAVDERPPAAAQDATAPPPASPKAPSYPLPAAAAKVETPVVIGRLEKPPREGTEEVERVRVSRGRRTWLWVIVFVALGGGLTAGAFFFIQSRFGVEEEEHASDSGAVPPESADAGSAAESSVGAAEPPDAGASAKAAEDGGGAAEPAPDTGSDTQDRPRPPSAQQKKLHENGLQLLRTKKYAALEKASAGWVKRYPDDAMMRYLHGRGLFFQKKIREAAEELERAVELDPDMVEAYYELGGVYLLLKQNAPASRALKRFLELSPGDRRAPPVRALLKKISAGGEAP